MCWSSVDTFLCRRSRAEEQRTLARMFSTCVLQYSSSPNTCRDSYPMQSNNGYQPRQQNPFAQQDNSSFESTAKASTANLGTTGDSMTAFYSEVRPVSIPRVFLMSKPSFPALDIFHSRRTANIQRQRCAHRRPACAFTRQHG